MPFYIRKALTRGPIRLNLSKSGLGASFGVKGLRIGVGPKGTYVHGGRGGLYFRKYLNSNGSPAVPTRPQEGRATQTDADQLEFAAAPASDDEVAAAINERLNQTRWSRLLLVATFIVPFGLGIASLYITAGFAFVALLVGGIILSNREAKNRRIELDYDLSEAVGKPYSAFLRAIEDAAKCSAIWRVTTQSASQHTKYTGGAQTLVERSPTRVTFNDPLIRANLQTTWLWVVGGKLALLPDRMLFFGPSGVVSMDYKDAHIEPSFTNFREDGPVPADSTNVGSTWQYVNKNGGPDRRFANNRQIPIQRYSDLRFTHPRLTFRLQFSRAGVADVLASALQGLCGSAGSARSRGVAKDTAKPAAEQQQLPDGAFASTSTSNPINVSLTQSFRGERAKIVETMLGISSVLQREVELRAQQEAAIASRPRPIDALTYTTALVEQGGRFAQAFREAEIAFARASSSSGTPEILRNAYVAFLDQLLLARRKFFEIEAPYHFRRTEAIYRDFLTSFYQQITRWPAEIGDAAGSVTGDSYSIELSANYDLGPMEDMLAVESTEA
jgi:hypothetical protein